MGARGLRRVPFPTTRSGRRGGTGQCPTGGTPEGLAESITLGDRDPTAVEHVLDLRPATIDGFSLAGEIGVVRDQFGRFEETLEEA